MDTPQLLKREIARAVSVLTTAEQYGYSFVVHTPEGVSHGKLVATLPKSDRHNVHPRGALKAIYQPQLSTLQVGELAVFKTVPYPAEAVRAAAGAYCTSLWGKGSYTSFVDNKTHEVQIMRGK